MEVILITIGLTITFDIIGGFIYKRYKEKKDDKKLETFISKIEDLIEKGEQDKILKLCRQTEGKSSYVIYKVLDKLFEYRK